MIRTPAAFLAALLLGPVPLQAGPLEFHLTFDKTAHAKPFTGRVHVLLFKAGTTELQRGPSWIGTLPFFAKDVKGWMPGETLVIDKTALGYPVTLDRITKGAWSVHAVMDLAPNALSVSQAPGNVFTIAPKMFLDPAATGPVALKLDRVYVEPPFQETNRIKLVDVESKLLTAFHGRSTRLRAGVVLPASYAANPAKKYPVVYEVPGFSANHRGAALALRATPPISMASRSFTSFSIRTAGWAITYSPTPPTTARAARR